jgi:hypothetical protein
VPRASRLAAASTILSSATARLAEPVDFPQPRWRRGNHLRERAETRDQRFGKRLHIAARNGAKRHQFEHLVIGERVLARFQEPRPQPLPVPE